MQLLVCYITSFIVNSILTIYFSESDLLPANVLKLSNLLTEINLNPISDFVEIENSEQGVSRIFILKQVKQQEKNKKQTRMFSGNSQRHFPA